MKQTYAEKLEIFFKVNSDWTSPADNVIIPLDFVHKIFRYDNVVVIQNPIAMIDLTNFTLDPDPNPPQDENRVYYAVHISTFKTNEKEWWENFDETNIYLFYPSLLFHIQEGNLMLRYAVLSHEVYGEHMKKKEARDRISQIPKLDIESARKYVMSEEYSKDYDLVSIQNNIL